MQVMLCTNANANTMKMVKPLMVFTTVLMAVTAASLLGADASSSLLKIAAYRDITAMILDKVQAGEGGMVVNWLDIYYVKDADEAHTLLKNKTRDLVFMSYDDTLSVYLEEQFADIRAVFPVHGGMLSLCGTIDVPANKTRVGIDTNTGYGRALRMYLNTTLPDSYDSLQFVKAGATNLRYAKVLRGELDATLLNPPYSTSLPSSIPCTLIQPVLRPLVGTYQGVVAQALSGWLAKHRNSAMLEVFRKQFSKVIQGMQRNSAKAVADLSAYYNLTTPVAQATYNALFPLEGGGLMWSVRFNESDLAGTEKIYEADTGVKVPAVRRWVRKSSQPKKPQKANHH